MLTGVRAGARDSRGNFGRGTVNAMVNARLAEMAKELAKFGEETPGKKKKK